MNLLTFMETAHDWEQRRHSQSLEPTQQNMKIAPAPASAPRHLYELVEDGHVFGTYAHSSLDPEEFVTKHQSWIDRVARNANELGWNGTHFELRFNGVEVREVYYSEGLID